MGQQGPKRFSVSKTTERDFEKEYIVQLHPAELAEHFPTKSEGEFLLIRNQVPLTDDLAAVGADAIELEIHARVTTSEQIDRGDIGMDFTLRTALGTPAVKDTEYSGAESSHEVEVEPFENPETNRSRRVLNWLLGVRPQVCRTRMGVPPDLEDKVCRLPANTLEIIGADEGDDIALETPHGNQIVRGVKAFEIDRESRRTKRKQKRIDEDRYPSCTDLLNLDRVRRTEVDIPELWIDEETRSRLGLQQMPKEGVCQPVRVYRDSWYIFQQQIHEFAIPLVIVLFATGLEVRNQTATWILWISAVVVWFGVLFIESRSRL